MSFLRHREIFRSDVIRLVRERRNRRSLAHRLDEFPVGYSSASCTPAELAPALPTGIHSATQARRRPRNFQPMANSVLTFCVTPGDNRRDCRSTSCSINMANSTRTYSNRSESLSIKYTAVLFFGRGSCARRTSAFMASKKCAVLIP